MAILKIKTNEQSMLIDNERNPYGISFSREVFLFGVSLYEKREEQGLTDKRSEWKLTDSRKTGF